MEGGRGSRPQTDWAARYKSLQPCYKLDRLGDNYLDVQTWRQKLFLGAARRGWF